MKWINAFGLLLQFLSFWFAAPELLGSKTLERFENGLRKFIATIPLLLTLLVIAIYGIGFSIYGVTRGMEAGQNGIERQEMYQFYAVFIVMSLAYLIFMIFFKKIRNWLEMKIAIPLTQKLIHNNKTRSTALLIGAILFSLGFLIQFVIIILQ